MRLLDACAGCGRPLSLDGRTDLFACVGCGADMLATVARPASVEEIELSAALGRAFEKRGADTDGGDLPDGFTSLPVGDMAAVVERLSAHDQSRC